MRAPVTVEISERWVKIVAVKPSVRQPQLVACLAKPIAGFSDEQITQTIARTFRELRLKARPLTVCLPRNLVTVRNLHLPSQNSTEITQMIDLNIVRMVPYRKEEVVSSYRLLGVDESGYAKVMLAIVHRDLIKRHVNILTAAGLSVERILLSSHGAWQWTVGHHKADLAAQELGLLLDVDATFTDLILFSREHLFFSRSIAIEADQLTEEATVSKLLTEVNQSLEIFQNEEMSTRPVRVFLSGAGVGGLAVERAISQDLKLPVVTVGSPPTVLGKGRLADLTEPPPDLSLVAAAQLATDEHPRPLSFLLPEIQIKQSLQEKTRELVLLGSLSVYLLTLLTGLFMSRLYHQQAYLRNLKTRNAAIGQEIGDLLVQSKRVEVVKECLAARELPMRYLAELQRLVPKEIAIDFLSVDDQQRGVLRGQALQLSEVFKFITTLEHSRYIDQVQAKYTRRKKSREKEVTEFELALQLHL